MNMEQITVKTHALFEKAIVRMLSHQKMSFWGEFALHLDFSESKTCPTSGVFYNRGRLKCVYNNDFMSRLTVAEATGLLIHELQHLILGHCGARSEGYDRKLANQAQDMVINAGIEKDSMLIGYKTMCLPSGGLFPPEEYEGDLIFEPVYKYLEENPDKQPATSGSAGDGTLDDHSLQESACGDPLAASEAAKKVVENIIEELRTRGKVSSDIEKTLERLQRRQNKWLGKLKGCVSSMKGSGNKKKTFKRTHRLNVEGLRGKVKKQQYIGVILDVSGSMWGDIYKVLGTLVGSGVAAKVILADTEIKDIIDISSDKDLASISPVGLGGTELQPAIDYYKKNMKDVPLVVMTDGYCDSLDVNGLNKVVILSTCVLPNVAGKYFPVLMCD